LWLGLKASAFFPPNPAAGGTPEAAARASAGQLIEKGALNCPGWMAGPADRFHLGFFIVMYKFIPLLIATQLSRVSASRRMDRFQLRDGLARWSFSSVSCAASLVERHPPLLNITAPEHACLQLRVGQR